MLSDTVTTRNVRFTFNMCIVSRVSHLVSARSVGQDRESDEWSGSWLTLDNPKMLHEGLNCIMS